MRGWRRLTGGLTSLVHRLTVEQNGRRRPYVLRWWLPGGEAYAAGAVASETAVLTALENSDVPAPRLVGATTDATDGGPAVLMTRLPGRMHLMPRDRERWLEQMAHMLVRIHTLAIEARPFQSWLDRSQLSPLPDASRPDIWSEAIALVAGERPPIDTCFMFSADVAERFRHLYEAEAGRTVDPWWDVHALLSFGPAWKTFLPIQIDGRAPLDVAGMTGRMEDLLERTLRRA